MRTSVIAFSLSLLCLGTAYGAVDPVHCQKPAPDSTDLRFPPDPRFKLEPFDMGQVRLLDGLEKREMEADLRYIKSIDTDGLLFPFRHNAGLPTPGKPFGGWESPSSEIRGTFTAHYLTTLALMYKSTGDVWLKSRAGYLVEELSKCQRALGGKFLAGIPTSYLDRVETGRPIWAPYYVVEKLVTGLLDVYQVFENAHALDMARRMGEYLRSRGAKLTDGQLDATMHTEYGGMAMMEYNLYAIAHNRADLDYAHRFDEAAILGPLALRHDSLSGLHANTNIPKILGAARRYELLDDPSYRTVVEYFWDRIANHRSYATGGDNKAEFWGDPDALAHTLVSNNQETCTTYNMLKVTRNLIRWTGDPRYADFYERAYFNGILPAQRPDTGMMIYYLPLAGGDTKNWGTPRETFWCCYCTGIESFAKLNDSIYFHDSKGVYVNLYVPSELNWADKGLRLTQTTRFPEEQGSTFKVHLSRPTSMPMNFHVPYWASGFSVSCNGKRLNLTAKPTSYLTVCRTWHDGDTIRITTPMRLHSQPMPDDPNLQAVMFGPIVLAGVMEKDAPIAEDVNTGYLKVALQDPSSWLKPVSGKALTFQTVGIARPVTFIPLYDIIDQRFGVYWDLVTPKSRRALDLAAIETSKQARDRRIVDQVLVDGGGEVETGHNLFAESSNTGPFNGRHYRDGKRFGWDLKIVPDAPMTLSVTYWGDDGGDRTFDIVVNDQRIATESLHQNKPGHLFDIEYPIPASLTANADNKIQVRFVAHEGNTAGGVFGCATLRASR
ncbi:MAG: glycoside hydrolase family 127 protein [Fimbriimonas sp.]|nr:glycoside hydrolase family 127 protein [Fimbriimonas sp.]